VQLTRMKAVMATPMKIPTRTLMKSNDPYNKLSTIVMITRSNIL
jgi:hypothetical protein